MKIIILAGGKGTRMKSDLPKALMPLKGKPMISHVLEAVASSGVDEKPIIVVGYGKEKVMETLGPRYEFVVQDKQLGTGHAVMSAEETLKDRAENIMVLPADHPRISPDTIKKLAQLHMKTGAQITMAAIKLPDFKDWRNFFYDNFSRVVRNTNGQIIKSVELKDASEEEKNITEVNPIFLCFDAKWLWEKIKNLRPENAQNEYYMTDLIQMAIEDGQKIESVEIDPKEGMAANSRVELERLEQFE